MIVRGGTVWLGSTLVLFAISYVTQATEFEADYISLAALFSFPIGVTAALGSFNEKDGTFGYPSIGVCVLAMWIVSVAPSLIVETDDSYSVFNYTQAGLHWARGFFFVWCLVFAITAGRPNSEPVRTRVSGPTFYALAGCAIAIMIAIVGLGTFSNYQGTSVRVEYEAGSLASALTLIGLYLPALLPPLCVVTFLKTQSPVLRWASVICFWFAWPALFLATSRTSFVLSVFSCLYLARKHNLRPRLAVVGGMAAAVPALLLLMFSYRQTLATSDRGATTVSAYVSTAADSTGQVVRDSDKRTTAINALSDNLKSRMWYGQQFSITADEWLDHGSTWYGSLFAGAIRTLPTVLVPQKNEIVRELEIENLLLRSGRFPALDLGPMPWQQWLFELGIPGILMGAVFYGLLIRLIDRRLSRAHSLYELVFWFSIVNTISPAEHTTDGLFWTARTMGVFMLVAFAIGLGLRVLLREQDLVEVSSPE